MINRKIFENLILIEGGPSSGPNSVYKIGWNYKSINEEDENKFLEDRGYSYWSHLTLNAYAGTSCFRINKFLRCSNDEDQIDEAIKVSVHLLNEALNELPEANSIECYRWVSLPKEAIEYLCNLKGKIISFPQFLSTSDFINYDGYESFMKIKTLNDGSNARRIMEVVNKSEGEILFKSGTRFEVTSCENEFILLSETKKECDMILSENFWGPSTGPVINRKYMYSIISIGIILFSVLFSGCNQNRKVDDLKIEQPYSQTEIDSILKQSEGFFGKISRQEYEVQLYDQVIARDSNNCEIRYKRAILASIIREFEKAISDYTYKIDNCSSDLDKQLIYEGRGMAYARMGDYNRAKLDFTRAIEHSEKINNNIFARAYYQRGRIKILLQEDLSAIADLTVSLDQDFGDDFNAICFYYRGITKVKSNQRYGCEDLYEAKKLNFRLRRFPFSEDEYSYDIDEFIENNCK
jgi:hypothetical protein